MLIWGKKRKEKSAGYVADFCPICRAIRRFELKKISLASHVYYVPYGDGDFWGYEANCDECSYIFGADISHYTTSGNANDDLNVLIPLTFPEIEDVYRERIEIEMIIKNSPLNLPADLRRTLLREPFMLLAPHTEQIYTGDTRLDWRRALGCLSVFVLPSIFLMIAVVINAEGEWIGWFATALAIVPLLYTLWLILTSPAERFRKDVVSKLVRSLCPLQPSAEELSAVFKLLEPMKLKIVKKVKISELLEKLQEAAELQFSSESIN